MQHSCIVNAKHFQADPFEQADNSFSEELKISRFERCDSEVVAPDQYRVRRRTETAEADQIHVRLNPLCLTGHLLVGRRKQIGQRTEFYFANFIFFKKATMAMGRKANVRLPPEVNRILYVKNLPYKITGEEMYDIFGKYGAIRQIRVGNTPETRGTAFVVYEDIFDAKNACDHLSGFNVCNRYLVVLYYQANKAYLRMDTEKSKKELERVKAKYGLGGDLKKDET
ncbi:Splicing factor 3B subunit [Trichinella pseudospiralis]